jgi:hypothetical protein
MKGNSRYNLVATESQLLEQEISVPKRQLLCPVSAKEFVAL